MISKYSSFPSFPLPTTHVFHSSKIFRCYKTIFHLCTSTIRTIVLLLVMDIMIDPIEEMLTTYNELNFPSIDVFLIEPSPLEFMRYVAKNRPFVVRGGAKDWKAVHEWNVPKLKDLMKTQHPIKVAITPKG